MLTLLIKPGSKMEMQDQHLNHSEVSDWLLILPLMSLLLVYLYGVYLQRKAGRFWSGWRTAGFIAGILLLAVALIPPAMQYAHHKFEGHMMQHLLLGMLAPLGLVLAAPVTLVLRSLPANKARIITALLGSKPFHYLSHPVTALFLNIGGMYLLYLTPLYQAMHHHPYIHFLVHLHFILAGYLFVWAIAGPDPAPSRPGLRLRLIVLFLSMATHAYLSKFMYAHHFPRTTHHSIEDLQAGAMFMYYGGDGAEMLLAIAFFAVWYRTRGRRSAGFSRRAF